MLLAEDDEAVRAMAARALVEAGYRVVEAHDGVLVKEEADSMILLFRRPTRALACAFAMHARCREVNVGRQPEAFTHCATAGTCRGRLSGAETSMSGALT